MMVVMVLELIRVSSYEGVSKSLRTGRLERELQMVQLSATRFSCIAILWVSLVSFAAVTLCVASQRVFVVVSVSIVTDSVLKLVDTPSYAIWFSFMANEILVASQSQNTRCSSLSTVYNAICWVLFLINNPDNMCIFLVHEAMFCTQYRCSGMPLGWESTTFLLTEVVIVEIMIYDTWFSYCVGIIICIIFVFWKKYLFVNSFYIMHRIIMNDAGVTCKA
jgi:hypothetical protein